MAAMMAQMGVSDTEMTEMIMEVGMFLSKMMRANRGLHFFAVFIMILFSQGIKALTKFLWRFMNDQNN